MPQQIIVTDNGRTTIVPTGPVGPPGPPGTPGAPGSTVLQLDLPLVPVLESMGMEMEVVSSVRNNDEEIISGVAAARLDMTLIGGASDITLLYPFVVDLDSGEYIVLIAPQGHGSIRTQLFYARVPDLTGASLASVSDDAVEYAFVRTEHPVLDKDAATKKYVDEADAATNETLSTVSDAVDLLVVSRAVKYGRNLGGKWAICGGPGQYETPDVGPFDRQGIRFRSRICPFRGSPGRAVGTMFLEIISQFRNSYLTDPIDQDNLEIAATLAKSTIGLFTEDCLIGTSAPVPSGEYLEGRLYTDDPFSVPPTYSGMDFALGDAIEFMYEYVYNRGDGRWEKAFFFRTDSNSFDDEAGDRYEILDPETRLSEGEWDALYSIEHQEAYYWKRCAYLLGPEPENEEDDQTGSLADSGQPILIGHNNGGFVGIEYAQLSHIDDTLVGEDSLGGPHFEGEELVVDFQSRYVDSGTGLATSLSLPGQVFSPYRSDADRTPGLILPVYDNSISQVFT